MPNLVSLALVFAKISAFIRTNGRPKSARLLILSTNNIIFKERVLSTGK